MGIAYGTTTLHQATKGIVQDGLILSVDAGVKDSYNGGTTFYDLVGSVNGTLVNGPTHDKEKGGSIVFDGTNDYVSIPIDLRTSPHTIISFARMIGGDNKRVISADSNNWLMGWWQGREDSYYADGWIQQGSSVSNYDWVCYAVTGDSSTDSWSLYKNGSLVITNNGGVRGPNGIRLGSSGSYPDEASSCKVATVLVYNRVLTASEISHNFNITRHRFGI
tara:strand:- start:35 stop:694 length:660 start_codon:yes stop_codon:yes gene_type:complete